MRTITVILEPEADGSLRLPLPPELRGAPVRVTARPRFGCLAGKIRLGPDFDEPLEDMSEYME